LTGSLSGVFGQASVLSGTPSPSASDGGEGGGAPPALALIVSTPSPGIDVLSSWPAVIVMFGS
jgi:hypothetical protein